MIDNCQSPMGMISIGCSSSVGRLWTKCLLLTFVSIGMLVCKHSLRQFRLLSSRFIKNIVFWCRPTVLIKSILQNIDVLLLLIVEVAWVLGWLDLKHRTLKRKKRVWRNNWVYQTSSQPMCFCATIAATGMIHLKLWPNCEWLSCFVGNVGTQILSTAWN